MKRFIWIIAITVFAGFLRFYQLDKVPPALNSDEVAIGYNAYSILKTGKDEYGTRFPLTFRSFDDYKMPVYVYLTAASMKLFGYNDFAVRFPSALCGTLTVLITYFLVQELFRKRLYGLSTLRTFDLPLLASTLLAISPWSLQFSRAAYEANVALLFIVIGVYLFLLGLKNNKWLPVSASVLSLSIWTYHSSRIFIPVLIFGLCVIYCKDIMRSKVPVLISCVIGLILLLPILSMSLSSEGQMRARGVSAFGNPDDSSQFTAWNTQDAAGGNSLFRFFHNRRMEYAYTFMKGYFSHFDPNFLFADHAIQKFRAPGIGLLYLFELPFLCIGMYMLFRNWSAGSAVLFLWILASPLAAAFTRELPHAVRTLVFLPSLQIVTAIGISAALSKVRKRIYYCVLLFAVCFALLNIVYYFHQYYVHLPVDTAKLWYVGRKEMVVKLKDLEQSYDRIVVSNDLDFPYIFYLYYGRIDPSLYLSEGGTKSGGFEEEGNKFWKYEFRSTNKRERSASEKVLFSTFPYEATGYTRILDTIYYPDGAPAIVIFE